MEEIHTRNKHAVAQALLAITRQKYWPEAGKKLAKQVVKNCVLCVRSKPKLMEQIMGELPAERVNMARPFIHASLDYCGPFEIHHKLRGKRVSKGYVCVFVCLTTKAVHLEPATNQSIDGFINCLKRFIARRGAPKMIISDNATNFRGTNNQLEELGKMLFNDDNQEKIYNYCLDNEITWKFAPARSPHFNGLSEAAVKSAKLHMKKVLHSVEITYDELGTIVAEIEAILNSRPLTPMSSDPNDLQPLTAGHFLIGAPLTAIDDRDLPYKSKTKMWHKIVEIRNEFWDRWSKEYMAELQGKGKWRTDQDNIKIGALVIMKEDDIAPLKWKMGRVTQVFYDDNEKVRVVELKTAKADTSKARNNKNGKVDLGKVKVHMSTTKRAIQKICPLPVDKSVADQDEPQRELVPLPQKTKNKKSSQKNDPKRKAIPDEPVAKRTRSKNIKNHLFLMMCAFLALLAGAFGNQCEYHTFAHNPGLYFEDSGKLSLTTSSWNINGYIQLQEYWQQQENWGKLLDNMNVTCQKMNMKDQCNAVVRQFSQEYETALTRNKLFGAFSHSTLTRKRRESSEKSAKKTIELQATSFMDKLKNMEGEAAKLWEKIVGINTEAASFLEKLKNEIIEISKSIEKWSEVASKTILSRKRRGWANIIGSGLNIATGVMDNDDAVRINAQINALNNSNTHLMKLMVNQTTIQDMTQRIIRKEEGNVKRQIENLQQQINQIGNKKQEEIRELFTLLSLLTRSIMSTNLETQQGLMELLMHVHHGKVSTTIMNPEKLKQHLAMITENIASDIMIPDDGTPNYIAKMYSLLEAKVHMNDGRILIKIVVPLLNREIFNLHHIIAVPFKHNKEYKIITTPNQFIAVNKREDRYYLITIQQKTACKSLTNNWIVCNQRNILYNMQKGSAKCEMAILTHLSKGISPKCALADIKMQQVWSKLHTPNQFLFTVVNETMVNIICKDESTVCKLKGSGIISLRQQCTIHTDNMEITADNNFSSELPIILAPGLNLSTILTRMNQTMVNKGIQLSYEIDPELDSLAVAIQQQKISEEVVPAFDWHHVHHYAMLYIGIISIMGIGIWMTYKRKRHQKSTNSTIIPVIVANTQEQQNNNKVPNLSQPMIRERQGTPIQDENQRFVKLSDIFLAMVFFKSIFHPEAMMDIFWPNNEKCRSCCLLHFSVFGQKISIMASG